jgi:flagellar hook protein FlgE
MMPGMYSAISGLEAHQQMLNVTANNLANVDTIGYKAQRTTFVDQLSQQLRAPTTPTPGGNGNGGNNPVQVGLGVQLGSIDNLMNQGSMQSTGNTLDIAIQGTGAGFFQVANGDPAQVPAVLQSAQYTRAGNFTLNSVGSLTNQTGQYVLGQASVGAVSAGNPLIAIKIPPGSTGVAVGQNGAVTYVDNAGATQTAGYLSLADFPNDAGLSRVGGSMWTQTSASGPPMTIATAGTNGVGTTIGGELEQSNVDMATEFSNMITAQRGFQANSRVITTVDQMLQTIVSMGQ